MFLNTAKRSNKKKTRNNDERNGEDKKNHKQYQIIKIKIKYDNQDITKSMKLSLIREVLSSTEHRDQRGLKNLQSTILPRNRFP